MSKNKEELKITKREFNTGGVKYIGIIYNDSAEYIAKLALLHDKSEEVVLGSLVEGYQALQMTRIAQGLAKGTAGLSEGQEVEVTALYGQRSSKWGDLAKYIDLAKTAISQAVSTGRLSREEGDEEWKIRNVAGKIKVKMEAIDSEDLV